MENDPEEIRIKYKYRRLILEGKIRLPYGEAVKFVGPDSAYHLYFTVKSGKDPSQRVFQADEKGPMKIV